MPAISNEKLGKILDSRQFKFQISNIKQFFKLCFKKSIKVALNFYQDFVQYLIAVI